MPTEEKLKAVFTHFAMDQQLRQEGNDALDWAIKRAGVELTPEERAAFVFQNGANHACVGKSCPPPADNDKPTLTGYSHDKIAKVFAHLAADRALMKQSVRALNWSATMHEVPIDDAGLDTFEIAVNFDADSGHAPLSTCVKTSCDGGHGFK